MSSEPEFPVLSCLFSRARPVLCGAVLWLAVALPPGAAGAATVVADYHAHVSVSVSVASARFTGSGKDAFGSLGYGTWDDGGDFGSYDVGAGSFSTEIGGLSNPARYRSIAGTIKGHAKSDADYAASGLGWYDMPLYGYNTRGCREGRCDGQDSITLSLDYEIEIFKHAHVHDPLRGEAWVSAEAFLGFDYEKQGRGPTGAFDFSLTTKETILGRYDVTMAPGSIFAMQLYIKDLQGEASHTHVSTMPLPAGLPMLLVSLLVLGGLARRYKS